MTCKYLGSSITSNRNLKEEVQAQTTKAAMMSGWLPAYHLERQDELKEQDKDT